MTLIYFHCVGFVSYRQGTNQCDNRTHPQNPDKTGLVGIYLQPLLFGIRRARFKTVNSLRTELWNFDGFRQPRPPSS